MENLDDHKFDTWMKTIGFPIKFSSTNVNIYIQALIEEVKSIVAEKKVFDYRDASKTITLSEISEYQDFYERHRTTVFSTECFQRITRILIESLSKGLGLVSLERTNCNLNEIQN